MSQVTQAREPSVSREAVAQLFRDAYAAPVLTGVPQEIIAAAQKRNTEKNRNIVKALVPIAERLAGIFGTEGITASTVRRHAIRLNIIDEHTPTHFLSSVMRQAKLSTRGETRVSTIPSTKGRRQLVYYAESPYAGS